MAAYAALISLSNTINSLLNHNRLSISLAENQQLLSLLEHVNSFEAFLERFPDKYNSLEGRMRELAHEAEDIIECFMLKQAASWPDYETEETILWLKQIINNINFVADQINEDDADSSCLSSSSTATPICKGDCTVGFEDYVIELKDSLCREPSELQVIPICGVAGTGKTTLARNVYDDPSIVDHFVIRVWVTISQYSSVHRTLSSILECLKDFNTSGLRLGQSHDEEKVYQILRGKRFLVVMDSIWSSKAWDAVRRVFPDDGNGSRVMLITRLRDVASYPEPSSKLYEMGLLSEDQSWNLLKRKIFVDEDCPPELENTGKEIARCCKGWPLALVAAARILSSTTRSVKSWEEVSEHVDVEKVIISCDDESRCHPGGKHELQLRKVMEEIDLIAKEMKEIKDSSSSGNKDVERGGADSCAALSSSSTTPPVHKNSLVGFEEHVMDLKGRLCGESSKLQVIPICGMGGIGKTTLARYVYDDPLIVSHFDVRIWVTISQDFSAQRILSCLMESLKEFDTGGLGESDDEKVHKILMWRRYLVVMDDMWSIEAWDAVRRVFPDDGNGSRVILTTRLSDVASYPDPSSKLQEMSLLSEEHSWDLLKKKVFPNQDCPTNLENIGKEIASGCKGLPLAIVVIAGLLSTINKNRTSWLEIAENVKSVDSEEHNQIEEILSFSYVQLPQYLRSCFLYMGSFSEDEEIHVKKLVRLWIAEGFIKSPTDSDSFEKIAEEGLEELVKRNLVLVIEREWDGRIKSCSLHDLMRDLCIRKSHESNFFLNMMDQRIGKESFIENVRNQRCVSVDSSTLGLFPSLHGSTIRSIKCSRKHSAGRHDFLEGVRLLRVLDAEPIDLYNLSELEHLDELFHLRYLTIRSHGRIPTSLSIHQNLQTLIIGEDMWSRSGVLVTRILRITWCMSQLRHVQFRGIILFDYPEESACPLENLQTLSYVSYRSCTEKILKLIPNLKRLKINCFDGASQKGAGCLNGLVHLQRLENLKLYRGHWVGVRPYKITFPTSLKKLILKKWRLPSLDDVFVVGSLPNLQVLKLKACDLVDRTWETTEGAFPALEVLQIEFLRLENWITESSHFPKLKRLLLHSCRYLNGIPNDIGDIPTLEMIRVTGYPKKSLVESVELIREEQEDFGNTLEVSIRFQTHADDDSDDSDDDDDDDGDDSNNSGDGDGDDSDDDGDYGCIGEIPPLNWSRLGGMPKSL